MYLIASYENVLSPEHADLSEVETVQLFRKVLQGLKENALKESNMWPQGFHGDIYGPHEPPPTTWPLDYVPDQIVDSIVDAAADHARFHDHTHHKMCGCKPAKVWSLHRPVYSWTPYTPRVKYLAWVNKAFRDSIFIRKLVPALCLCSSWTLFQVNTYLNPKYYPYVKQDRASSELKLIE
jgi:hypothetical protein